MCSLSVYEIVNIVRLKFDIVEGDFRTCVGGLCFRNRGDGGSIVCVGIVYVRGDGGTLYRAGNVGEGLVRIGVQMFIC